MNDTLTPDLLKVAVDAPLKEALVYLSPQALPSAEVNRGTSVIVPLGKRSAKAVVLGPTSDSGEFKLKAIKDIDSTRPILSSKFLDWIEWLADYYLHPVGLVSALAFPPLKRAEGKRNNTRKSEVIPEVSYTPPPELTNEQRTCFEKINSHDGFNVHLLHGVTGSGKTEVYLHLLEQVLAQGKTGLVLVPEISLTPQLLKRFSARFPDQVAVIHSHLTEREKTNQWWEVVQGQKKILIGARSALFCPMDNIGLIIVDEEHEPSFKQDEKLKYHGRDAAIMKAKIYSCPIVLGSATPSMESWHNALEGKYQLHQMTKRVADRLMPEIAVVDMREEREQRKVGDQETELPFWLSEKLYFEINETLLKGQQVALFLNRRGMAQVVLCQACGYVYECPNCAISLTLHAKNHMVCHYCDYSQPLKEQCDQCSETEVRPLGLGTELVENDISKLFPEVRTARADRDEINSRQDLEELITSMENKDIDILVGTQMIAKGLDFPKLTLVGLIMADVGFNLPDFRSTERSFQLLTQVSGRSGRHISEAGKVIIQTYNPEHLSVTFTQQNDFEGFARSELLNRKDMSYPPFGKVACIKIQGMDHNKTQSGANWLGQRAQELREKHKAYESLQILGPAPASIARLRNKYRYQMLIKAPQPHLLKAFSRQLTADLSWLPSGIKVQVDIDPINML